MAAIKERIGQVAAPVAALENFPVGLSGINILEWVWSQLKNQMLGKQNIKLA